MNFKTIVERAYELAESSECAGIKEIKAQLKKEGYFNVDEHLSAHSLARELKALCAKRATTTLEAPAKSAAHS